MPGVEPHLPAVAQSGGDAVDRQVTPGSDIVIAVAGAIPLQELDLHVIERIEIGEAVTDRARQERVALKQALLAHDRTQRLDPRLPFRSQSGRNATAPAGVRTQLGIA